VRFSEAEIQDYLWKNRERFAELLVSPDNLDEFELLDDFSNLTAHTLLRNRITKKLKSAFNKLYSIELIGREVPLEQQSNSTIRADFLVVFPGNTGLGIIELKKSAQTERQAFTELLAYSNHLTTLFPTMSREDSVYILISPMTTRICRDALLQSLTFDNRNIVALMPTLGNPEDLGSLKLQLWIPAESELSTFSSLAFREDNFSVCKVVWEYSEGWWDAAKGNPSPELVKQLNNVSAIAAQCMEEMGIHGFTYCSQTWPELEPLLHFTNSLLLVGLNPYAVGGTQFVAEHEVGSTQDVPSPYDLPNISELIPGLNNHAASIHQNNHYLAGLHKVWDSQLYRIGKKVVDSATQTINGQSLQTDQSFMNWHDYQEIFLEDISCNNFDVRPTGLLRHLYMDVTKMDYDVCGKNGIENHPVHGDIHHNAIETLTSQYFFRFFIRRLLGDIE